MLSKKRKKKEMQMTGAQLALTWQKNWGSWHVLAYLPRCPMQPNTPNWAKSRQVTCYLPDDGYTLTLTLTYPLAKPLGVLKPLPFTIYTVVFRPQNTLCCINSG